MNRGFVVTFTIGVIVALFGLIWSQLGFTAATQRGRRDFASISQIIATKYEVLVEHKLAEQARGLLAAIPPT